MTKQMQPAITTPPATSSLLGPLPSIGNGTSFKSGSQLPSISNDKKPTAASLFPNPTVTKKQEVEEDEDEEEYDDQYEEEEDEDDGDFDANELLNLTDY